MTPTTLPHHHTDTETNTDTASATPAVTRTVRSPLQGGTADRASGRTEPTTGNARQARHTKQRCAPNIVAAEDVLPGHPDRLCDAFAEAIVETACTHDPEALVGVEIALHRHTIFVSGRVAAGRPHNPVALDLDHLRVLADDVFSAAGYTGTWAHHIEVITDLDVVALSDDERAIRRFSDDQTIAVGYADPTALDQLPVEAAVARRIRQALATARRASAGALGPDGKVLVGVRCGERPSLELVNIAIQHAPGLSFEDLHRLVLPALTAALTDLTAHLEIPDLHHGRTLRLNGIGDFSRGGPLGDNGLSGKKLVVDHYGPHIPIGGGALCGKDPHKADRVGPLRARQLAVRIADTTGQTTTVHIGWLPGLEKPDRVTATLADGSTLDLRAIKRLINVPDLSLAGSATELELAAVPWRTAIERGYVGSNWQWDR